jgi:hypothetical protein
MNDDIELTVVDPIREESKKRLEAQFEKTYQKNALFLDAWKRGVKVVGLRFFYSSRDPSQTVDVIDDATDVNQLAPKAEYIREHINVLSSGERKLLAAMCSIYNEGWGGDLLKDQGVNGLAGLIGSQEENGSQILADLVISYTGW